MKMKKLLSMVLALALMLSVMSNLTAFAVWEDTVTLFETDFENETVGEAPRTVNGQYVIATTNNATVKQGAEGSENATKYIDTIGGSYQRIRMWFNDAVSTGVIVAEFDLNPGIGNVALGLIYENSATTYAKWPFFLASTGDVKGNIQSGGNPPTETDGSTTPFTLKANNEEMTFKQNTWQHYKVRVDLTAKTVTAWIDGVESNTITGYEYFTEAIGGMAFYVNKAASSESNTLFDNIKIYKEASYGNYYIDKDFEKDLTGVTVNSATTMVLTSIAEEPTTNANKPTVHNSTKYLTFAPESVASDRVARIMFPKDATTQKSIEIKSGKLFVEFDALTEWGAICVSVVDNDGSADNYKYKCIMAAGTKNSTPSRGLKAYTSVGTIMPPRTNAGESDTDHIVGYRASGAEADMAFTQGAWQHVKLEIDIDNASVKCTLDGVESEAITGFDYFTDPIAGFAFRWFGAGGTLTGYEDNFIDNIKVYTTSDGKSINDLKSGSNVIRVTLKDTVDAVTTTDIKVTDAIGEEVAVSNVELSEDNKNIFVTLEEAPEEGTNYIVTLADSLKYADGYDIVTKTIAFDYTKGTFTVNQPTIETVTFTKDGEVVAKCIIDAYDFSSKTVKFYIATYNGGILKDVNVKDISVDYKTYGQITDTVNVTLTDDATLLKAFVWDNNLIPYVTEAEASSTPEA